MTKKKKKKKQHTFVLTEEEYEGSNKCTYEWEKRANVTRWEHDHINKVYRITIN